MQGSFIDAVRSIERELFAGRTLEQAVLDAAYRDAASEPRVVSVLGAGGVGKTALVRHFTDGLPAEAKVAWLGTEQIAPNPRAVREELDSRIDGGLSALGWGPAVDVLVVDALERGRSLETWLFEEGLNEVGRHLLVLITSREPLSVSRRAAAAFQRIHETITLGNLTEIEARGYLTQLEFPTESQESFVALSGGHPLALNLMISRHRLQPGAPPLEAPSSDVIEHVLTSLLEGTGDPILAEGLQAISLPRRTERSLLSRLVGARHVDRVYGWLSQLPFVEVSEAGLIPHATLRERLHERLIERSPERLRTLVDRVVEWSLERLDGEPPAAQRERFLEMLYACRHLPLLRETIGSDYLSGTWMALAEGPDAAACRALVERWQPTELDAYDHWVNVPGSVHYVIRDGSDEPAAFGLILPGLLIEEHAAKDSLAPHCLAAFEGARIPLNDAHWFRFWLSRTSRVPGTPEMAALLPSGPPISLSRADLGRYMLYSVPEPEEWLKLLPLFPMWPAADNPVRRGDVDVGFFLGDVSESTGSVELSVAHAYGSQIGRLLDPPSRFVPPVRMETFVEQLREALRLVHEPEKLNSHALTEFAEATGLVKETGGACTVAVLQRLVGDLEANPAHQDSGEILRLTYIEPEVKQLAVAETLSVPFGTYRYRLRKAMRVLAEAWVLKLPDGRRPTS